MYKKFCCGVYYLLRDKAKSDIPFFATFMLTLFLVQLSFYGINSLYRILFDDSLQLNGYMGYSVSLIFGVPNYFFVFRNKKFMEYYKQKMPSIYVIAIVVFVFTMSLFLILQAGPINKKLG